MFVTWSLYIRKREDPENENDHGNECLCGGHYSSRLLSFGEFRLVFSVRLIYKVRKSRNEEKLSEVLVSILK